MDAPKLDLDEVFLDALEAVVLAALEWIGNGREARFRFFRRLLAVAEQAAVVGCSIHPPGRRVWGRPSARAPRAASAGSPYPTPQTAGRSVSATFAVLAARAVVPDAPGFEPFGR